MIKTKQWSVGDGSATIQYDGQGDGEIIITSDPNSVYEARSMQISVETTDGSSISRTITIQQAAKQRIDLSAAVVTAATQTYSGSAKTPTPTVTLNGSTVPSSGYDVSYSNNTNAGTATIIVTGKGDYTGTAYGTFTINKASRTISWSSYPSSLYVGSTDTLSATASAGSSDGTISYSSSNSSKASVSGSIVTAVASGTCTIYASISEGTNYLSASTSYTLSVVALPYVDLGLPSGKKWAVGNIVSDGNGGYKVGEETDFGAYFSWGNVTPHFSTNGSTFDDGYNWGSSNSGVYASTPGASLTADIPLGDFEHDAALRLLGNPWHMPNKNDFQELYDNTDKEFTTISGINGWKFMKKTDHSVYVFFPLAGVGNGTLLRNSGLNGYYWSDSWSSSDYAYYLKLTSSSIDCQSRTSRYRGNSIRAVQ